MKTKFILTTIASFILILYCIPAQAALTAPTITETVALSTSEIQVSWIYTNGGRANFEIERSMSPAGGFVNIETTGGSQKIFTDSGLASGISYYYRVRAYKSSKRNGMTYSPYSNIAGAMTEISPDTTPPSVPQNLNASATSCSQVSLSWSPSTDTGGSGLNGYRVYRNGSFLKQVTGTSTTDTGLQASTGYSYRVSAIDNAGNQSAQSTSASASTPACPDTTPPSVPQNLNASATSCSQVSLSWSPSTDTGGSGLKGYNLYRSGSYIKQVTAPATSTTDSGLSGSATYLYTARAVDNAGNVSGISNTASTNTPACQQCGNGVVETGEECDDGNLVSGDGCSDSCLLESPGAGSSTVWAEQVGGAGGDAGYAMAHDNAGNLLVAGYFKGTVDFGSVQLTSTGFSDMFIAKYSPSGINLWAKHFGGSGSMVRAEAIAVGNNNNIFITGSFKGSVNFGGGSFTSYNNSNDIFLAKLSSSGNYIWAKRFGNNYEDSGYSVAVDSLDNVIFTGNFYYSVNFGDGWQRSIGLDDIFLAKFSSAGNHLWSKTFGWGSNDKGSGVATDDNDNIVLTGSFIGTTNFGGGPVTSVQFSNDIFLVKYSPSGTHLWTNVIGAASSDHGNKVAISVDNEIFLTGSFAGTVDFGGGYVSGSGSGDAFIAKFSSSGGYMWDRNFGSTLGAAGYGVAVGEDGVVVTGYYNGSVDCGGGLLASNGASDIIVTKYTLGGTYVWSTSFGSFSYDAAQGIAVDVNGYPYVTGYFQGTVDFGTGPITSAGQADAFLVKLEP
jgi:cysteine-rich repeat protein